MTCFEKWYIFTVATRNSGKKENVMAAKIPWFQCIAVFYEYRILIAQTGRKSDMVFALF